MPLIGLAIILALSTAFIANAQVESGKIVGTVKDASVLRSSQGPQLQLIETQTNAERKITTNSAGEYVATELKPGSYTVKAEHPGFKTAVEAEFKLDINQVIRVDFAMVLGSVQEQVTVTAAEPLVQSETSSIGQVIDEKQGSPTAAQRTRFHPTCLPESRSEHGPSQHRKHGQRSAGQHSRG